MDHHCCMVVQPEAEHFRTAAAVLGSQATAATEICTKFKLLTEVYIQFTHCI
jgi:hypothetical protein